MQLSKVLSLLLFYNHANLLTQKVDVRWHNLQSSTYLLAQL